MLLEWLKPVLFVLGYVALMRWLLPALGISTCMSGSCRIPQTRTKSSGADGQNVEGSGKHA